MKNKIKLISIKPLKTGNKKYIAEFEIINKYGEKKKKTTKFGAKGMSDYTIHKDKERRNRYIKRHVRDLRTNDPTRAGYLSMYILWNKKTFKSSLSDYKSRLNKYNKTGKFDKKIPYSSLNFGAYFKGSRLENLPIEIQEKILELQVPLRLLRKLQTILKNRKVLHEDLKFLTSLDLDPDEEKYSNLLNKISIKLTKRDLIQNPEIKILVVEIIKDYITKLIDQNAKKDLALDSEQLKSWKKSQRAILRMLNKMPEYEHSITKYKTWAADKQQSINPLVLDEEIKQWNALLTSLENIGPHRFGALFEGTWLNNLPSDAQELILKRYYGDVWINKYNKIKKDKIILESLTEEITNPEYQTDNEYEYIFDWGPYDEKSVEWLKRASTVLNKRDLYDDEYKEYIGNFIRGFRNYRSVEGDEVNKSKLYLKKILLKYDGNPSVNNNDNDDDNLRKKLLEDQNNPVEFYDRKYILEFFDIETNSFGRSNVPKNVKNPTLYLKIKAKIKKDVNKKNRRWGAYDSGRLVREYKEKGGKYSGKKKNSNLDRWYKEKWIDACAWPKKKSCGRTKSSIKSKVTYCRPSKIIDSKTPTTIQELTKTEIKKRCKKKSKNPKNIIT